MTIHDAKVAIFECSAHKKLSARCNSTPSTSPRLSHYSGVGTTGAPGAGVPVKFYWSEVKGHPRGSAEVALCSEAVYGTQVFPVYAGAPRFQRSTGSF